MFEISEIQQSGIFDFEIYPVRENRPFLYKGLNKKGLLVAMVGEEQSGLESFLEKILQAVGYDLSNDTLHFCLTSTERFWFKEITWNSPVRHAIFFGVDPRQAGLNLLLQPYKPLTIPPTTFLFAHSLAQIQQNPALKRPLWEALKMMFNP